VNTDAIVLGYSPQAGLLCPPTSADSARLMATFLRHWKVLPLRSISDRELSFSLRYQVYCEERGFLHAADYPDALESDEFDDYSLHFGAFNAPGELVGTARLVLPNPHAFPMFQHCTIDPACARTLGAIPGIVEISRLAISRRYRRRADDGDYGLPVPSDSQRPSPVTPDRRDEYSIVVSLFKAMYQAARRNKITHAVSAMELSLRRLLKRYHFPLEAIGPECDYFGPVTPFILDIDRLEHQLTRYCPDLLHEFRQGLEPEYADSFAM